MDLDINILEMMCKYCNNYFNKKNAGFDATTVLENAPPSFLDLAKKITEAMKEVEKSNVSNSVVSATAESVDLSYNNFMKLFQGELGLYKRVKFI